jgi:hypothetical protein
MRGQEVPRSVCFQSLLDQMRGRLQVSYFYDASILVQASHISLRRPPYQIHSSSKLRPTQSLPREDMMCVRHHDFFTGCLHVTPSLSKPNFTCSPPCVPPVEIEHKNSMLCGYCIAALMRSLERVERAQSQEGWMWTLKVVEFSPSPSPEERPESACTSPCGSTHQSTS